MCYTVEHNVFVDRTGIINNVRGAHNSSSTRRRVRIRQKMPPACCSGRIYFSLSFFLLASFSLFFGAAVKTQVTSRLSQIKAHKVLEKMAREASGERVGGIGK